MKTARIRDYKSRQSGEMAKSVVAVAVIMAKLSDRDAVTHLRDGSESERHRHRVWVGEYLTFQR